MTNIVSEVIYMVIREYYLKKIRSFYHDNLVKIIYGIRTTGKSFFLESIYNEIKKLKLMLFISILKIFMTIMILKMV